MCKQGTYGKLKLSSWGSNGFELRILNTIDACIVPIVQALNDVGITTVASCCGHGNMPGSIALEDGREILIARNYDEARLMENVIKYIKLSEK
jgi:predicted glycosyl hydrolase (DUF1957 family)